MTLITGPALGPEGELFSKAQQEPYKIITVDSMIRAIAPLKDLITYRQIKKHLQAILWLVSFVTHRA